MAGMITQLAEIMTEQAERCNELLGLTLEEKDVLVKNDVEELQKLTNLKNMVITQNNRLERKRISLVNDIAEVMGHTGKDIDLTTLLEIIGEQPESANLQEVGSNLKETLHKLKEANDLNRQLLEASLEYVNYSLNMVMSSTNPDFLEFPDKGNKGEDVYGSFDTIQ